MRVLIGCEFSGVVRDAFLRAGHDAMSCDLLPTDAPGPHHRGDVLGVLTWGWDLAVFHPPCTYLANAGARWLYERSGRWAQLVEGAEFFRALLDAPIPRVAVENPTMHPVALEIVGQNPTQIIQPWQFGHMETKATGLWLRGLPPLRETRNVHAETMALPPLIRGRSQHEQPGPARWKRRSVTYPGIAQAMAEQWE